MHRVNDFKIQALISANIHDNRIVSVNLLKTDNCFILEVCNKKCCFL